MYSRFVNAAILGKDTETSGSGVLGALIQFAMSCTVPPVLFYQQDSQLLLSSQHRDQLATAFRFVIADAELNRVWFESGSSRGLGLAGPVPM
jgi:D-aspartate ligase